MNLSWWTTFFYILYFFLAPESTIAQSTCGEDTHGTPSICVMKKRNGHCIEDPLVKSGFMDVTRYVNKILCIRGSALLYSNVDVEGSERRTYYIQLPERREAVFYDKCVVINQIVSAKAKELRDRGINLNNLTYFDLAPEDFVDTDDARRVAGVYFISEPDDFSKPTAVMFLRHDFEYIAVPEDVVPDVRGASFVTVGEGPFCLPAQTESGSITIRLFAKESSVCSWTLGVNEHPDIVHKYDKIFVGNRSGFGPEWESCGGGGSGDDGLIDDTGLILPQPAAMSVTFDPFSINEDGAARVFYQRRLAQMRAFERGNYTNQNSDEDYVEEGEGDFELRLIRCRPLRQGNNDTQRTCADDSEGCDILNKVLMLTNNTDPATNLVDEHRWKKDVLNLASEIFGKICEPFSPLMPFTVSRIIEYYLAQAHLERPDAYTKGMKYKWNALLGDLDRCRNASKRDPINLPIKWYWDVEDEMGEDIQCTPVCPFGCELNPFTKLCMHESDTCFPTACMPEEHCRVKGTECEPKGQSGSGSGAIPTDSEMAPPDMSDINVGAGGGALPSANSLNKFPIGQSPFGKVLNQDVFKVKRKKQTYDFSGYPSNVLIITMGDTDRTIVSPVNPMKNVTGECLFFHEEMAETEYDLNIAIDIFWKIWATVMGYCNKHYFVRKSETFPRLYISQYEDFLFPIFESWTKPIHNEFLKVILSPYNTNAAQRWLDICVESSYHAGNSPTYRPQRPLELADKNRNYFIQLPDYVAGQFNPIDFTDPSTIIKCE